LASHNHHTLDESIGDIVLTVPDLKALVIATTKASDSPVIRKRMSYNSNCIMSHDTQEKNYWQRSYDVPLILLLLKLLLHWLFPLQLLRKLVLLWLPLTLLKSDGVVY
jgi:hypothetical protein